MKVVMAPVNIAGQPIVLVKALRRLGVDISLMQYTGPEGTHKFKYETDRIVQYGGGNREAKQLETIETLLKEGTDIFHFWLRSLYFFGVYDGLTGFDIPIIRNYGRHVVYRFTGEDLRVKSLHMQRNPHNAYQYGYATKIDEQKQRRYLDFLRENVDQFVVQDPEMHEFCPEAAIIPRTLDLSEFPYVGGRFTDRPLVIHAPSSPVVKGTQFVRKAVESLTDEGLSFDYRELQGLPHDEALALYREADIIVDQLHIGWYGVLAVEGMAFGKAVISYVRPEFIETHIPKIPIILANPLTIVDVLRRTVKDSELRMEVGRAGRAFAEAVHDVGKVAPRLLGLYEGLSAVDKKMPAKYGTLEYFRYQRALEHDRTAALVRKARAYDVVRAKLADVTKMAKAASPGMTVVEIARLRQRADRCDELEAEAQGLRYGADQWDEAKKEMPQLRYNARQWLENREEFRRLQKLKRQKENGGLLWSWLRSRRAKG